MSTMSGGSGPLFMFFFLPCLLLRSDGQAPQIPLVKGVDGYVVTEAPNKKAGIWSS